MKSRILITVLLVLGLTTSAHADRYSPLLEAWGKAGRAETRAVDDLANVRARSWRGASSTTMAEADAILAKNNGRVFGSKSVQPHPAALTNSQVAPVSSKQAIELRAASRQQAQAAEDIKKIKPETLPPKTREEVGHAIQNAEQASGTSKANADKALAAQTREETHRMLLLKTREAELADAKRILEQPWQDIRGVQKNFTIGLNPFAGKTPVEIDQIFRNRGFQPRGPNPMIGKGGYVNPQTGRSFHIDPGGQYKSGVEAPHVDVNRLKASDLPKKKLPIGSEKESK